MNTSIPLQRNPVLETVEHRQRGERKVFFGSDRHVHFEIRGQMRGQKENNGKLWPVSRVMREVKLTL